MPAHKLMTAIRICSIMPILLINVTIAFASDPGKNGKIAFQASYSGSMQIYTVNPDGTDLFQVTNLPATSNVFALWPDFSPDGKRIVFPHDMTGALELYVVNPDGTNLTQITHDGRDHVEPRWSPDGTHIVFGTAWEIRLKRDRDHKSGWNRLSDANYSCLGLHWCRVHGRWEAHYFQHSIGWVRRSTLDHGHRWQAPEASVRSKVDGQYP